MSYDNFTVYYAMDIEFKGGYVREFAFKICPFESEKLLLEDMRYHANPVFCIRKKTPIGCDSIRIACL